MGKENPYFLVFEEGEYTPGAISAEVVDTNRRVTNELHRELDSRWDSYPGKKWPNDTKPSRYRYEGCRIDEDGSFTILVSPTVSYKDHITWGQELTELYGQESAPLAIATTGIIETSDNKIILTKRVKADYKRGGMSGAGGFMTIKEDVIEDRPPDIVRALKREVEEETGIKYYEMNTIFQGIYHNPISGSVNLAFVSKTSLSAGEVIQRPNDSENELLVMELDPESIQNLILTKTNAFTTETLALLIVRGEKEFGEKWAEDTRAIFKLRSVSYAEAINRGPDVVKKLEERDIRKI